MQIRLVKTIQDFEKFAAMARQNETREYDCTVENYIKVVKNICTKPWCRLWIAVDDQDRGIGYIWVTADMTTLRDQVNVGDMYVRPEYRKTGIMVALHETLCQWAFASLRAKRIRFDSPISLESWQRQAGRMSHEVTIRPVNSYVAVRGEGWVA